MADPLSTGMDKAGMKALLNRASPTNPISFAFGADKKQAAVALLVMDKSKNPKACQKLLLDQFPDAFNLRYGTLIVDPADDAAKVKFKVNKAVSGFAKRLGKTLKGTGFKLVEIMLEDGTSVESASDEDMAPVGSTEKEAATAPAQDPAELSKALGELARQIKTTAGGDAALMARLTKIATDANVNIKTNNLTYAAATIEQLRTALASAQPVTPTAGSGQNTGTTSKDTVTDDPATSNSAALSKALATLIARIKPAAGADTALLDQMATFAKKANADLKTGNLKAASEAMVALKKAIDAASAPDNTTEEEIATPEAKSDTATPRPKGAAVRLAQAMIVWNDARKHVSAQIKLLQQEIIAQTADEPDADEIKASLGNLEELLENLDDGLIAKLNELRGTTDPDKKAALSDQARAEVRKMQDFANSDPLLSEIDNDNGFVPLTIKSRVDSALAEVLETL